MVRAQIAYILGLLLLASAVSGCTSWPAERGGGAAELTPPPPGEIRLGETRATWSDTLYLRLEQVEAELERFTADGGMIRAPAALTLARTLSVRVRRQLAGGLDVDAAIDLLRLEEQVIRITESLDKPTLKAGTRRKIARDFGSAPNA